MKYVSCSTDRAATVGLPRDVWDLYSDRDSDVMRAPFRNIAAAAGFGLLGFAMPQMAQAQDLGVLPANGSLTLPLDISTLSGDIAIEIDNVDVTEFASIVDGQIVLMPGSGFEGGGHVITVYLSEGAGYNVVASYSFTAEGGAPVLSVSVQATHEAGARSVNGTDETYANSSGSVEVSSQDGALNGQVSYLATSRAADQINGNTADIATYALEYTRTGGALDFTGRLGHQALSYDRALIADISRRGVGMEFRRPDDRLSFGLFAARAIDALGAENFTGLEDADDRIFGAQLAFRPFATSDLRVSVQAYQGDGVPEGGLVAGRGDGISVGLEGTAQNGRLRYGLSAARAQWDEDAGGGLFAENSADALLSYLDYDVLGADGGPRSLTVGLAYERVEQDFFSLANPGLAVGAETYRVTADYAAGRFGLYTYAETQLNNVGGQPDWPTDRLNLVSFDGRYALEGSGIWENASLRFGASVNWQRREKTPALAPPQENFASTTVYVGLDSFTDTGSWSLDYTYIDDNDQSAFNFDGQSHGLAATFDWQLSDRVSLNGSGSATHVENPLDQFWRNEISVGVQYDISPGVWSLAMNGGFTDTGELGALSGGFVSGELAWSFNPAADLVLSAAYRDGPYASESGESNDTVVGVFLRAQTSIFR